MAEFPRHALDHLSNDQNQKYAYHRVLANYEAGLGDCLDILSSTKAIFGDYCGVLLFHQVHCE